MRIKGTVQRDFLPPVFSSFKLSMGLNIYDFGYKFVKFFKLFKMIPWRVNIPGVRYPGESIFKFVVKSPPGYDTLASQSPRSMIPRRVNLPRVYHTPGSQFFERKFE